MKCPTCDAISVRDKAAQSMNKNGLHCPWKSKMDDAGCIKIILKDRRWEWWVLEHLRSVVRRKYSLSFYDATS